MLKKMASYPLTFTLPVWIYLMMMVVALYRGTYANIDSTDEISCDAIERIDSNEMLRELCGNKKIVSLRITLKEQVHGQKYSRDKLNVSLNVSGSNYGDDEVKLPKQVTVVPDIERVHIVGVSTEKDSCLKPDSSCTTGSCKDCTEYDSSSGNVGSIQTGDSFPHIKEKRKYAVSESEPSESSLLRTIIVYGFGSLIILLLLVYGVRKYNSSFIEQNEDFFHDEDTISRYVNSSGDISTRLNSLPDDSSDFYWEENGHLLRLIINPSKRVSITNDPYTELLSKQKQRTFDDASSDSERSFYGEDDFSDFETDSIRELEFECLENNLHEILEEDKLLRESKEKKRKKGD